MPRPGTVSCLYIAVAEETKTTSQHWRSAWRPAIQRHSPCGKTGARAQEEGRAGEMGGAQGATHHSPCTVSSSSLLPGEEAAVSCENTHWASSPGRGWQKVNPWCFFVIIWAWSHAPLSQMEHWFSHATGQVCMLLSTTPRLGKFTSFLLAIRVIGTSSIVFWKHSICQDDRCPSLGLQWWQSTSSFLFEEDMWRVVPGNSEIRGGFLPDWALAASEPLQSPHSPSLLYPPQQSLPISFPLLARMSNSVLSSWLSALWQHVFCLPLTLCTASRWMR